MQPGYLRVCNDHDSESKLYRSELFAYRGSRISHYTGLEGLYGIIETGGFWLSDHRYLNDAEEFENGRKLTQSILKRMMKKERYRLFFDILQMTFKHIGSYSDRAYYVCSFSLDADNLDQWRAYARDGQGISMTFDNSAPNPFFDNPVMNVSKVIYDDRQKSKIIITILRRYAQEFVRDLKAGHAIEDETWASQISEQLVLRFMNFKHRAFASEMEARMIVATSSLQHFKSIKHRVRCDRIVPYIESRDLLHDSSKLPLLQVCVGPTANQELTYQSIRTYLKNIGYGDVSVIKSTIPYRR